MIGGPSYQCLVFNAAMVRLIPLRQLCRLCIAALVMLVCGSLGHARSPATQPAPVRWQAVLVAGDDAQPVFDNAVLTMAHVLSGHDAAPADIHRLSANPRAEPPGAEPASDRLVLQWIASLHPGPGEGCLVFVTSHGQEGEGVWLAASGEFLRPAALAEALSVGCATAPTVVVISSCYSGAFATGRMRAPNRIILTAARPDRPSFGCQADRTYTVFDECLLGVMPRAPTWQRVRDGTFACVRDREKRMDVMPSEPQSFFGAAVRNLPVR